MKPSSIQDRQEEQKKLLLEQLQKTPIVQIACEKSGVGRATYYRWRNEDPDFAKEADTALKEGRSLVNDMAESQLMSAIRDKNMTAIIYWLKHHHESYTTRVEISGSLKTEHVLISFSLSFNGTLYSKTPLLLKATSSSLMVRLISQLHSAMTDPVKLKVFSVEKFFGKLISSFGYTVLKCSERRGFAIRRAIIPTTKTPRAIKRGFLGKVCKFIIYCAKE